MRTTFMFTRLAALAAVALVLTVVVACNETSDPGKAENVILVTSITTAGTSVGTAGDTTATLEYTLNPRGGNPDDPAIGFFHDLTLTSYTVGFSPAVIAGGGGAISTGYCLAGSPCAVTLVLVPDGSKPGAGTTVIATVQVEGKDVNNNPVNFDATVPLTFIP